MPRRSTSKPDRRRLLGTARGNGAAQRFSQAYSAKRQLLGILLGVLAFLALSGPRSCSASERDTVRGMSRRVLAFIGAGLVLFVSSAWFAWSAERAA